MAHRWDAEDYARHSRGQEAWARELLDSVELRPHDSVLDIGCGDGRITASIAERVPLGRVVGVDSSAEMTRYARATFTGPAHPNLSFEQADARALPFESAFSVVYSSAALHWVHDHRPVIAGIARALPPEGRFVAQMGGRGNGAELIAVFDAVAHRPPWAPAFVGFSLPYGFHGADDYECWLRDAGLRVEECRLIPKDMVHAGREAFVGWLRSAWLPYTERVEPADRADLIEEVAADYLAAHPPDAQGAIHVAMVRLQVRGRKP